MYYQRITNDGDDISWLKELETRVANLESPAAGDATIRGTYVTVDPNTGAQTQFGTLPDGSRGFKPFIYDITPPPVATAPVVRAEPGVFVIGWDGLFVGGEAAPLDFECCNIIAHRIVNNVTVESIPCGMTRRPLDITFVQTDIAPINTDWEFSLEAEDYNGNRAAWSERSNRVTMQPIAAEVDLTEIEADIQQAKDDAFAANQAAGTAQTTAENAAEAAAQAAGIASTKGKVIFQNTAPSEGKAYRWTGTANDSTSEETLDGVVKRVNYATNPAGVNSTDWSISPGSAGGAFTQVNGTIDGPLGLTTYRRWTCTAVPTAGTVGPFYRDSGTPPISGAIGDKISAGMWIRTSVPCELSAAITFRQGTTAGASVNGPTITLTAGVWTLVPVHGAVATAAFDNVQVWPRFMSNTAIQNGMTIDASAVLIEKGTNTLGTYFDGGSLDEHNYDLWINTAGNAYTPNRWNGTSWSTASDKAATDAATAAQSAFELAQSKGKVLFQTTAPTGDDANPQTLWIDTTGGANTPKRWTTGTTWVTATDKIATDAAAAATAASNLAASKGKVIIQPNSPDAADRLPQNLWIDTNNGGNTPKRWNTTTTQWEVVTDKVATDAAALAATANSAAGQAASAAASAAEAAGNAQTTANGKNRVWYQDDAPAGTAHRQDDIWFDTNNDNKISRWNATTNLWVEALIGNNAILANLDAGKITVGYIAAAVLKAKSISVDKLVITSTDNLVVEADFANEGLSWGLSTNVTIDPTGGRSSLPAMKVTGTTATRTSLNLNNKITVGSEDRFRASAYVKSSAALVAGKVEVKFRCYTTATVFTDIVAASNSATLVVGQWTLISGISPVLPAGTLYMEMFVAVTNVATGTITHIDYVGVTRAADGALVLDGAMDAKSITGSFIQTDNSVDAVGTGRGLKLNPLGFKAYNAVGQKTFEIAASTGNVVATGTYSSGTTPEEGASGKTVRVTMGILNFQNWQNAPGLVFESFDTGTSTTTPSGFMFYYFGGIQIRSTLPSTVWSQFRNDSYVWVAQDGLQFTSNNSGRTEVPELWATRSTLDSRTFPGSVSAPANTSHMRMGTYSSPNAVPADSYVSFVGTRSDIPSNRGFAYIGNYKYNINTLVYDARVQYTFEYDGTARLSVTDDSNVVRSRLVSNGGAQTGPWQIQGTGERIELIGGTTPFASGSNRARLALGDDGAFLFGPTWANYFFATSTVVGMAGNIQINGEAGIKHRRAEFYTTNFANPGGNQSWDTGPATLDTSPTNTRNNDFCQVGPFNGSISFTKAGYYEISCLYVAVSGLPGNGWMKLNHSALGLQGMDSIIGGQKHEAYICLPPTYYGVGDYVRTQTALAGAHSADTRWKVVRSILNV